MTVPHPLIQRLRTLRENTGVTRHEATRKAGLGEGAIRGWETGRYGATIRGLEQYAAIFGLVIELVAAEDATDFGDQLPYGQITVGDGEKWCGTCHQVRSVRAFHVDRARPDGRKTQCRYCRSERRERLLREAAA